MNQFNTVALTPRIIAILEKLNKIASPIVIGQTKKDNEVIWGITFKLRSSAASVESEVTLTIGYDGTGCTHRLEVVSVDAIQGKQQGAALMELLGLSGFSYKQIPIKN